MKSNDQVLKKLHEIIQERAKLQEEVRLLKLELERHYDV